LEREAQLDRVGKEIDLLINLFYGKEYSNSKDYYGKISEEEIEKKKKNRKASQNLSIIHLQIFILMEITKSLYWN